MNRNKFKVVYFSSEMEAAELRRRLDKFKNLDIEAWSTVKFRHRATNFQDVIEKDSINLIDYLELNDELNLAGSYLSAIQRKLQTGLSIVALQKKRGVELGHGA